MLVVGCQGGSSSSAKKTASQNVVPKLFFDRTISYRVHPDAKEYMSRLESLASQMRRSTEPIPDNELLPLYRDADVDRDHFITRPEAEAFYQEYVLKFENALGPIRFNPAATPESQTRTR